tara:strand:- start:18795 stop:19550 length:756 start_codon:yes stop_codon:yes gene_type:complete
MKNIFKNYKNPFLKHKVPTLTVVGVGPGDTSLLTLGALRAIKEARYIFFPVSNNDNKSYAADIVKKYIRFKKKIPIIFPMAREAFNPEKIWEFGAKKIITCLNKKNNAVLLCLGDPSLFASSSYILQKIHNLEPEVNIKKLAGISSISAAAAYANYDLVKQGEILKILECPNDSNQLISLLNKANTNKNVLGILKIGKRWPWVKEILKKEGLINKTLLASNVGLFNQFIDNASNYKDDNLPYFSLLIIRFS